MFQDQYEKGDDGKFHCIHIRPKLDIIEGHKLDIIQSAYVYCRHEKTMDMAGLIAYLNMYFEQDEIDFYIPVIMTAFAKEMKELADKIQRQTKIK